MRLPVALTASLSCLVSGTLNLQPVKAQDQPADSGQKFFVGELSDPILRLSKSVGLIGQNRVEEAFEQLDTQSNPAFRNPQSYEKFHDSWNKLFQPLGRLRLEFETYDVIGFRRVSTQAYFIYGTANGANGPSVFDFRLFKYKGKWHVHGFSFRAAGWDRDPELPKDAVVFDTPVVYPISDGQVAGLKIQSSIEVVRR